MATSTVFRNRKTPGVYVTELEAFPPSIIGVETAVPAFIGYTQTSKFNGVDYTLKPLRISSMVDYVSIFGGPPTINTKGDAVIMFDIATGMPAAFTSSDAKTSYTIKPLPATASGLMYYAMELFYANGGGACYIVSTGHYPAGVRRSSPN